MRIRRAIAALAATAFVVVCADASVASAAPATAKRTPTQAVNAVALRTSDFRTNLTAKVISGGTSLEHDEIGSNCGMTFASHRHRLARRDVDVYDADGNDLMTNETTAYQSTEWAIKALNEWRTSVTRCKSGRYLPVDDVETGALATTILSHGSDPRQYVKNNVVTVERVTFQKTGVSRWLVIVLQQKGNMVTNTLYVRDAVPTKEELGLVEFAASISGKKLAAF